MADPIVAASRTLISEAFDILRTAIDGASDEALEWEAGATEHTNSIAALTRHGLGATRSMLATSLGLEPPDRDREAEFTAPSGGADTLLALIDDLGAECLQILDNAPAAIDWSENRPIIRRDGSTLDLSAAFWMIHVVEHLRGHADEAGLTRHVWNANH